MRSIAMRVLFLSVCLSVSSLAYVRYHKSELGQIFVHVIATDVRSFSGSTAVRYDTRCYFYVRSKVGTVQFNLTHGTKN